MRFPRPDKDAPEEVRGKFYFSLALALGMILSTLLFALLEHRGITNLLPGWP